MKPILILCAMALSLALCPVSALAAGSAEPEGPPPEFEYIELKPITLPIITDRGLTQQVNLVVSLELPYGTAKDIRPYEPRLADAYLRDLYGMLGAGGAMMKGDVVDVAAIKSRLSGLTTQILGEKKVNDVLLQVVQQRRL